MCYEKCALLKVDIFYIDLFFDCLLAIDNTSTQYIFSVHCQY